ncbi:hypothetical protein [Trichocoleus sp. AS-A1]|uniref:hypothetical protein n=1 Tax=Trichocoleus sp. AS-A1 TaxID=2933921 RepID=UPI003297ED8E
MPTCRFAFYIGESAIASMSAPGERSHCLGEECAIAILASWDRTLLKTDTG